MTQRHLSTSRFTAQDALDISHFSWGSSLNGKWTVGDIAEGWYSKVNNEEDFTELYNKGKLVQGSDLIKKNSQIKLKWATLLKRSSKSEPIYASTEYIPISVAPIGERDNSV